MSNTTQALLKRFASLTDEEFEELLKLLIASGLSPEAIDKLIDKAVAQAIAD